MKGNMVIIMLLAVLAACSMPAMADCGDVVTVKTGIVVDGKVTVQPGPGGTSWTFDVPDGDVQFVRVHWNCWNQAGANSATFTNSDGVQQQITIPMNIRTDTYGHWECGYGNSHNYWNVNATPGSNTLSGITNCDCRWKFVDKVIDNTTEPATHNGHWWLNQGLIKPITYTTWFDTISTGANHTLWTVQSHHGNMNLYFNDVKIDDYNGAGEYPFDVRQNSVSNINTDGLQSLKWVNIESGSYPEFFAIAAMLAEEKSEDRTCGDVTDDDLVDTGDVILLSNYVGYSGYTLPNEWAGDVTGDGLIDTGDVILLSNYVGYQGYSLNCT